MNLRRLLRLRHPSPEERAEASHRRSSGMRDLMTVCGLIVLSLVVFLATMLMLPPMLELRQLEHEQAHVRKQLERARDAENRAFQRLRWMSDPEYYEQVARDRANQAKDGETIIRRPQGPRQDQNQAPPLD